jgi:protein-disulfide isomerase
LDRHPAGRLVAVTLVGIAALSAAEWCNYEYASEAKAHAELQTAFAKLDHEMEQVRKHAKTLYSLFQRGEQKQIPLRDDAPLKNPGADHLVAVVISDFRCPHCARFAQYMKEVVEPMFGEELAITFKHFPADTTCNRRIRSTLHPKACLASTAVEAARLLGGTDAFWKAHDLLFASQDRLRDDRFYSEMAQQLGLDQAQFAEALTSPGVLERIDEDIELAVRIGLRGTPAVYVEGRLVPSLAREQDVFWEEIKRRFDRRRRSQPPTNTPG